MAWTTDLVLIVRSLLGDLDSTTFTDDRLQQLITVAAYHVVNAASFDTAYTIDISAKTISPDPVTGNDKDFVNLVAYKTACVVTGYELKNGDGGFMMKDGPSTVQVQRDQILKESAKHFCEAYDTMLKNYLVCGGVSGSGGPGQAILGPYSPAGDLILWNGSNHRSGPQWQ